MIGEEKVIMNSIYGKIEYILIMQPSQVLWQPVTVGQVQNETISNLQR